MSRGIWSRNELQSASSKGGVPVSLAVHSQSQVQTPEPVFGNLPLQAIFQTNGGKVREIPTGALNCQWLKSADTKLGPLCRQQPSAPIHASTRRRRARGEVQRRTCRIKLVQHWNVPEPSSSGNKCALCVDSKLKTFASPQFTANPSAPSGSDHIRVLLRGLH